jgi:hypothetical protein
VEGAPSLNRTSKENSLNYCHHHELGARIYYYLGIESLPKDNLLDGKVGLPLVLKCLRLTIGFLPFEEAHAPKSDYAKPRRTYQWS